MKYIDLSSINELKYVESRGKGLLILGMHYGPKCIGYLLHQLRIDPVILMAKANITDLGSIPFNTLLSNEFVFKGNYEGIIEANHSERQFVKMMRGGRPGMMMIDFVSNQNFQYAKCLDINYPIGIFSFKLALKYGFPVVIAWLTKIKGHGYKLNFSELHFNTEMEGVLEYGKFFDKIVRSNPYLWIYGRYYIKLKEQQKLNYANS